MGIGVGERCKPHPPYFLTFTLNRPAYDQPLCPALSIRSYSPHGLEKEKGTHGPLAKEPFQVSCKNMGISAVNA